MHIFITNSSNIFRINILKFNIIIKKNISILHSIILFIYYLSEIIKKILLNKKNLYFTIYENFKSIFVENIIIFYTNFYFVIKKYIPIYYNTNIFSKIYFLTQKYKLIF